MIDLDARMKEAGMIPLSDLLNCDTPLAPFQAHAGITDLAGFEWWIKSKHEEYLRMRLAYELGDREKDEMYEWVFAHSAVFGEILVNWKKAHGKIPNLSVSDAPKAKCKTCGRDFSANWETCDGDCEMAIGSPEDAGQRG